ncbi:MAG: hypothetical protein ACRC1K_09030 [Planctomycetia bacterium]
MGILLALAALAATADAGEKPVVREKMRTWLSEIAARAKTGDEYVEALSKSKDFLSLVEKTEAPGTSLIVSLGEVQGQTFKALSFTSPEDLVKPRGPLPAIFAKGGGAKGISVAFAKDAGIKSIAKAAYADAKKTADEHAELNAKAPSFGHLLAESFNRRLAVASGFASDLPADE